MRIPRLRIQNFRSINNLVVSLGVTTVANGGPNAVPAQVLKWRATPDSDDHYVYVMVL